MDDCASVLDQHWYRTLDATAGFRAYMGARGARRFWHGYYNIKSIDHYTGAPLAIGIYSASKNEHTCYPDLFERLQRNIGGNPESIVADKGFSIEAVFAHNTNNGVASVIPWRKGKGRLQRQDFDTHDRHGIPRCKHCGAECEFIRFRVEKGGPRLWFRCLNQANRTPAACARIQSITCKTDYRLLLPLWRTEPIYHELASSHSQYERVHRHWRERYLVAGDNLATRPKRRGIGCQELRAQAALLAEWLRISWREGWLGSARRNKKSPARYASFGVTGSRGLKKFRIKAGLRVPYGQQAALLGLGEATPPSRRVAAPPGDPPDYGGVPF
ncbi:MAG: transposase [Actinobacteria bacterium]|nr:transposase [Actinomycetota bacterium]